ncbi:MAG: hypothetical protein ACO4AY_04860 [Ilumatobacteraceae bacterium]
MTGSDARPAWLVLDAARTHRFTGEVVFRTDPVARVSFDRGEIYFAERTTDSSLARRLIESGVLTAAQVDRGSVRIGGVRHLGRLVDRVPGLDLHVLLAAVDLLTDECVSWLAARPVSEVAWVPYRRHPSGVHQWRRYDGVSTVEQTDPLLSPLAALRSTSVGATVEVPVTRADAADAARAGADGGDVLIEWEEPSWLGRVTVGGASVDRSDDLERRSDDVFDDADDVSPVAEWASDVITTADRPVEPVSSRRRRPDDDPIDRFELVWPSGEVDDQLGAIDEAPTFVEPGPPAGETAGRSSTDVAEPVRPATSIRRSAVADDPPAGDSSGATDPESAGDDDGHDGSSDVGIDAHPATRRRMIPRRR